MSNQFRFWGTLAEPLRGKERQPPWDSGGSRAIWGWERLQLSLYVQGQPTGAICSWHNLAERGDRPSVLAYGSLYLASDTEYDQRTSIERLPIDNAPNVIATLYEKHGTGAFAFLDGDFSLVLADPDSSTLFLVVDKFGCNDLYIRQENQSFFFASHPECLLDGSSQFDPLAVAFLLAQEGFIPAPFTLASNVKSIGRARFTQVSRDSKGFAVRTQRYWSPSKSQELRSGEGARSQFSRLLESAVDVRLGDDSAVLLSGGVDSTVVFNFAVRRRKRELIALTGAIRGYRDAEREIEAAGYLARALEVPHEVVVLDPKDETLPEEARQCTTSWMNGTRLTLPLWRRHAQRLRDRLGAGYTVLAGQTADTLADNNYTLPSAGYTCRRALFSSWFLRWMPLLRRLTPRKDSSFGRLAASAIRICGSPRIASMFESLLDGMADRDRFYAGRLFGYGEVPGLARDYFPMLNVGGFTRITEWYSANFVRPITQRLEPSIFYREMIELSLDMVMLHLDSRLLFHVYCLEGGRAQLPFMDSRVVNFFCTLPYTARALWREPKHIVRAQLRNTGMISAKATNHQNPAGSKSQEELLLGGSLGTLFRELLGGPTFVERVPGLFELLSEAYLEDQIDSFRNCKPGVNFKFIAKVGALELWSRVLAEKKSNFWRCAIA